MTLANDLYDALDPSARQQDANDYVNDERLEEQEREFLDYMAEPENSQRMWESVDDLAAIPGYLKTEFADWLIDQIPAKGLGER